MNIDGSHNQHRQKAQDYKYVQHIKRNACTGFYHLFHYLYNMLDHRITVSYYTTIKQNKWLIE